METRRKKKKGSGDESFRIGLKPFRRINTGFSTNGVFPKYICSKPYKYRLRIFAPIPSTGFIIKLKKVSKRTGREQRIGNEEGPPLKVFLDDKKKKFKKIAFFYSLQFMVTSNSMKNCHFRLIASICMSGKMVFRSSKFKIVARKNKIEDDRFWNQFPSSSEQEDEDEDDDDDEEEIVLDYSQMKEENNEELVVTEHGEDEDVNISEPEVNSDELVMEENDIIGSFDDGVFGDEYENVDYLSLQDTDNTSSFFNHPDDDIKEGVELLMRISRGHRFDPHEFENEYHLRVSGFGNCSKRGYMRP